MSRWCKTEAEEDVKALIKYRMTRSCQRKHVFFTILTMPVICASVSVLRILRKQKAEDEKQKKKGEKEQQTGHEQSFNEQTYAENIHLKIMGDLTTSVSFDKVAAFEREIKAKIIFHHTAGRKRLVCYKTHDEISKHTVWLYLQDNHYLIENPAGFFGSAHVCNYCYETYEAVLSHSCKLRCNVCFTDICHAQPTKTKMW